MTRRRLAVVALIPSYDYIWSKEWLGVSRKGNPNDWGLPGGKVDPGEDLRAAVAREVLEETGIIVRETQMLRVDNVVDFTVVAFYVPSWAGDPVQQPGEGLVGWQKETVLSAGSFGAYNAARFADVRMLRP